MHMHYFPSPVPPSSPPPPPPSSPLQGTEDVDLGARLKVYTLLSGEDSPVGIIYAIAAGDDTMLRRLLEKFPGEVSK